MKGFIHAFVLLSFSLYCAAQDGDPTAAPTIKSFALDPDISGVASNSVNLFTGDVALPLSLVSLSGHNGLDVNVSISYNSNVKDKVGTWNLNAPTGILGLGWSMDIPRIVADHKQTGTRMDDTYYLIEGGTSNRLIRTTSGTDEGGSYYVYETKNFHFWKIKYYYDISEMYGSTSYGDGPNKWEIIKEDGTRYVYGDKNSGRNTLQYTVRWGNWIGNSAQTQGQSQLVHAWNLSEIVNLWGQKILFEYNNIEQFVGTSSGEKHTEASYLKKITGTDGKSVVFVYGDKHSSFYMEPHVEKAEPDAYQEVYERKYLDYIEVLNEDGHHLFNIDFNYRALDGGTPMAKMLLASIIHQGADGTTLPAIRFDYYQTGDTKGFLEKIMYPTGGSISYSYTETEIPRSNRKFTALAPSGYAEPQLYFGADYVVVAWRELGTGGTHETTGKDVKLYVYQWVGEWKEQFLETIENVKLNHEGDHKYYVDFKVVTEDRFFAVLSRASSSSDSYHLYIRFKDEGTRGVWESHTATLNLGAGDPSLLSGENFVTVGTFEDRSAVSHRYTFLGDAWRAETFNQSGGSHYYASANNYFISHNRAEDNDNGPRIHFHFLTDDRKWQSRSLLSSLVFPSADSSYWYASNSYAMVMASSNPEYIYRWDLTYTNFYRDDVLGAWVDESFVFPLPSGLIGLKEAGATTLGKAVRFDGTQWINSPNFSAYAQSRVSFGDDYVIWTVDDRDRPVVGYLRTFNPNALAWSNTNLTYTPNSALFGNMTGSNPVKAGSGFFSFSDKIYFRKPGGMWLPDYQLTVPTGGTLAANSLRIGSKDYFIYRYGVDYINTNVVQFVKNGAIGSADYSISGNYFFFGGQRNGMQDFVKGKTIATYHTGSINDATSLSLYRLIDEQATGVLVDFPVSLISVNDGLENRYTSFEYNSTTATFDATGSIAYYNEVTTVPGSDSPATRPYGYTKSFFFNGLTSSELGVAYQPVDFRWNGLLYEQQVFESSTQDPVAVTRSAYATFSRNLLNDESSKVESAYYIRPQYEISLVDGMETKTEYESFDLNSGLIKSIFVRRGTGPAMRSEVKYWWEIYDNGSSPRSRNLLTPVVQTKKTVNNETTEIAATRWKDWMCDACPNGLAPGPFESYVWRRNAEVEFSAWGETDPVDGSLWKLVGGNALNPKGQPVVSHDVSLIRNSTLWHPTLSLVIARVSNANADEVLYEGFEDYTSNYSTDVKTGLKSSQIAYNVVLPSPGTYTLTYWSKSDADWILNVSTISSNTTIGGVGTLIDEVRLHPQQARMVTYAYDDYGNVISVCDENNRITYTEYDEFNRVRVVRDSDRDIREYNEYNFGVD